MDLTLSEYLGHMMIYDDPKFGDHCITRYSIYVSRDDDECTSILLYPDEIFICLEYKILWSGNVILVFIDPKTGEKFKFSPANPLVKFKDYFEKL